jgi:SlyX protein
MDRRQDAESRLDEVESRLAFQDDLIESLNRVVARQELELADLSRRLRTLEAASTISPKPPVPAVTRHEVPPLLNPDRSEGCASRARAGCARRDDRTCRRTAR